MKRAVATVEEHPKGSGRYRARARIGGKLRTLASGVSRAEAEEAAAAYQHVKHVSAVRDGVTVRDFGIGFLDRRERQGIRGIRSDRSYWKSHIESDALADLAVSTLSRRDIVEWRDRRHGIAHRTRVKLLNLLRVALDEAVERELLETNPARDVRVHKAGGEQAADELDGILTPAEQHALVAVVPERERRAVVFALCTGLRQAEQWWLTWDDVRGDHVEVRKSTGGRAPKSGKGRPVYLLGPALTAIASGPGRSPYVFPAQRGGRRQEGKAPKHWPRWVKAAGIARKVRWHDLRHTCATSLLAGWWGRKWSLDEVCKLLGHSSVKVTEIYAKKLGETQRLAVASTPHFVFPGGNGGGGNLPKARDQRRAFVKHRSSVQIRQSAPVVSQSVGEQSGNFADADFAAWLEAFAEHSERAAAYAELGGGEV
jgi:integrase